MFGAVGLCVVTMTFAFGIAVVIPHLCVHDGHVRVVLGIRGRGLVVTKLGIWILARTCHGLCMVPINFALGIAIAVPHLCVHSVGVVVPVPAG